MRRSLALPLALAGAAILAGPAQLACESAPRPLADEPTYASGVQLVLGANCARCHAGSAPAGGFRSESYRDAIGCAGSGRPVVVPAAASLLEETLARPSHRDVVTEGERTLLVRWVRAGAPSARAAVHPARFADPRAPDSHVQALRAARHRPLFDTEDPDRCAQCHEGAGARPQGITTTAPGATACTTCHDQPGGALACPTCHGAKDRAYPPQDPCFFGTAAPDVHAAHAAPSRTRSEPLDCAMCHPRPETGSFGGAHGDGHIEVWFPPTLGAAKFDPATKRCSGTCHDRGGARPTPAWHETGAGLGCNDCHGAPPRDHYAGPCTSCHREADANGTSLARPMLHANGKVDLGDGSGKCGACHGSGDSPWPKTGAHAAHMAPAGATPVACETCHLVPSAGEKHPLRAGAPAIRLAGLAAKSGHSPSYDPVTKTCAGTYCHEGSGAAKPAPRWTDGAPAIACGSCHSAPPPAPHPQAVTCGAAGCHSGSPKVDEHVNGIIDRSP